MTTTDWRDVRKKVELLCFQEKKAHIVTKDGAYFWGEVLRYYNEGFDIADERRGDYPLRYREILKIAEFKQTEVEAE